MICPECGNECQSAKFCPECGNALPERYETESNGFPEPLIGRYEGILGYMEVCFYTVTIYKDPSSQITTSYQNISNVMFQGATQEQNGFLAFREKGDSRSMPMTAEDAQWDETALPFRQEMNDQFYAIYAHMKSAVPCQTEKQEGRKKGCCPKCGSEDHVIRQNRFSLPYGSGKSLLLTLIRLVLTFYHALRKEPKTYSCNACGHEWLEW